MKPYYFIDPQKNFGDDLNPWLWPKLVPGIFDESSDDRLFIAIGTLLNQYTPMAAHKVVFGAGVGYGQAPAIDDTYDIRFVRGPLSAQALGLPDSAGLVDPAYALALLAPDLPRGNAIGFMPHCRTADNPRWQQVSENLGFRFITPRADVEAVLQSIAGCRLLVTEALHGAIVADALRIPWVPICMHDYILDFKWRDWCASINEPYEPLRMTFMRRLEGRSRRITQQDFSVEAIVRAISFSRRFKRPQMSSDGLHAHLLGELEHRVGELRTEIEGRK